MTNIEKIDQAYQALKMKYNEEVALHNIEYFLKSGEINYITSFNGARNNIKDMSFTDIFEVLSKYALLSFIRNNKEVTLTYEEINKNVNDLDRKIIFTFSSAVETFVLANAINPFHGYISLACSKNMKEKLIQSFVLERYKYHIKDDLTNEAAKFLTIMQNNEPKQYITSTERLTRCVNTIREEEQDSYIIAPSK